VVLTVIPNRKSCNLIILSKQRRACSEVSLFNRGTLPFVNRLLRLQTYFFVAMACPVVRGNNTSPIADFGVPVNGQPCALARLEPEHCRRPADAHPSRACSRDRMNTRPRLPAFPYTGACAHQDAMLPGGDVRQKENGEARPDAFCVGGLAFDRLRCIHEGKNACCWDRDSFPILEYICWLGSKHSSSTLAGPRREQMEAIYNSQRRAMSMSF
jgi:hypothetical protein